MSRYERDKGARGEREVCAIFREAGWPNAERTSNGRDIAHGPAGCHFETKFVERLNVPGALAQVRADADPLDIPVLVHRPSRAPWMASLPLGDLLDLLKLREL
jgi:hypothetical protein